MAEPDYRKKKDDDDDEAIISVTSGENGERVQQVFLRKRSERRAMGATDRLKSKLKNIYQKICCVKSDGEGEGAGDEEDVEEGNRQYRLEATRTKRKSCLHRVLCCFGGSQVNESLGVSPNQRLARYLHWMFRINFFFLFALSCVVFFALTFIFAALIIIAGTMDSECVRIGGLEFNSAGTPFADAFALSWTTFSTVGYGSTYPALTPENDNPSNCLFITAICSLESFIGVLYSGFCGAILFGKVLRIQSHAQVLFSDPLVIRFGSGVESQGAESDAEDHDYKDDEDKNIPCPVLEFRIINRLFNEVGGEIMDATLNVVASVDANDVDDDADQRMLSRGHRQSSFSSLTDLSSNDGGSERVSRLSQSIQHMMVDPFGSIGAARKDHQTVDEDPSSRLVSKRVFSKMLIEANEHPFFKRVWLARHVLDAHSPLLTPRTRRLIRKNKGYWPAALNNYEDVKESLQFHQILVSLNGVSNVSASDVYAQKIYDAVDINVGYQFVNLLYRDADGSLKVDTDLINDVREQNGGGGEPLFLGD